MRTSRRCACNATGAYLPPRAHDSPRILQAAAAWAWGTSYDIPMHPLPCSDCPHTLARPESPCPLLRRFLSRPANCTGVSLGQVAIHPSAPPSPLEFNVYGLPSAQSPRPPPAYAAPIPEFPARTVTSSHVGLGNVVMHRHAPPPPVKAIVRVLPSVELPYPPLVGEPAPDTEILAPVPPRLGAWCPAVMCTFARLNTHACTPWGP
jgi:hypothetical protein